MEIQKIKLRVKPQDLAGFPCHILQLTELIDEPKRWLHAVSVLCVARSSDNDFRR